MKLIVCVNTILPSVDNILSYDSGGSLRDYDLVIFDPALPAYGRIDFTGGGSCITIEGNTLLSKAQSHWSRELRGALAAGKSVFVILSAYKEDHAATGSTMKTKGQRLYNLETINNYSVIPANIQVRNSRGRSVLVKDAAFRGLYDAVKEAIEYKVVFEASPSMKTTFTARDGTPIGGVVKFKDRPGALVLLPYFDFEGPEFSEVQGDEEVWTKKALNGSHALVRQIVAIDQFLKGSGDRTPPPDWLNGLQKPKAIGEIESAIVEIEAEIDKLRKQQNIQSARRDDISEYAYLLYENGKPLERGIEKALQLLGYAVETLRIDDLEIDHVIVGPSGRRMVGESEGKDSSAIDISKFRQLESNIGEDFERDEVDHPAKGVLFGNGFRLSPPEDRAEQFTDKCLKNAARLGTALVRTADLYQVVLYVLDHPEDDSFRSACRAAIEDTAGGVVAFPKTPEP